MQAPITDLNLKAESKVSLEAAVENVRVEAAAQNTTMTVAKDVEVKNLATETKIEVSGEGKLTNVITTDTNNVTGNIKAETTTVNENPIQESNKEVVTATPTPVATNAPKPTAVPTKAPATPAPTVEPTPVPPSTPKPTPTYTVNFVLDGYSVDSQSIKQGEKITKPVVSLKDDVYAGSYVLWLDDLGNIYDFNTSVTSAKTLTGKITVDATSENIAAIVADTRVSAMNLTQDITLDKGLTISRDLAIFGNNTKLTITSGDAFIVDNKTKFSLNNLTVDAIGKNSRGISIGYDIDFDITLNSTVLLTNARGISNNGIEDKSKTEKLQSNIFLNNSEIRNKRITDIETDVIYESSRGISLFDSVGTVSINSSKIYGYQYGINVGGDNPRAEDNNLGLNVTVLNSNINAWGALNVWGSYGNYLVKGSTLKGINKLVDGANSFSTIVFNNDIYGIFDNQKAFSNKMTIEDSTVTNYQTDESKLSRLSQTLIRVDCGLDEIVFKGNVKLIDTTGKNSSGIDIDNMNDKDITDFISNNVKTEGATLEVTSDGKTIPLVINPLLVEITNSEELNEAIANQKDYQQWTIHAGTYDVNRNYSKPFKDQIGWYMPISGNNITIFGDDVTIDGVTIIAQRDPKEQTATNKAIEVIGKNFVLKNSMVQTHAESSTFAGSIYLSTTDSATTLENVTLKYGRIATSGAKGNSVLNLVNVLIDYAGSIREEAPYYGFGNTSEITVNATNSVLTIKNLLGEDLAAQLAMLPAGMTAEIQEPDVTPTVSDATIVYSADSQNLLVEFKLNNGYVLNAPELLPEELGAVYTDLLTGDENASKVAASKIGSDLILNYYYINGQNQHVPLMTAGTNGPSIPVMKNKYWDGYLNYYNADGSTTKLVSGAIANTLLGVEIPNDKTWTTSTNIYTGTVAEGWLDDAKGRTVYVDIIVLYNGKVSKTTVSVSIPANVTNEQVVEENNVTNKDSLEVVEEKQEKVESTEVNESNTDSQDKENVQEEPTLENEEKVDSESIENSEPPVETPSID